MRLLFFFLITSITIFFSCNTTEPEMKVQYPPGYQHDIPWPSLADSPWPMYRGDAQNTGRSKSAGAELGVIEWSLDSSDFEPTAVIGSNNLIYVLGVKNKSGLYAIDYSGNIKWKFPSHIPFDYPASPVIGSDGSIIYFSIGNKSIYIIDSTGNLVRSIPVSGSFQLDQCLALNKDGTILFLRAGCLYSFDRSGNMLWKNESRLVDGITLSPDGRTIYTNGDLSTSFWAIDAATGANKWTFNKLTGIYSVPPVVDCDGTIYTIADEKDSSNSWFIYAVNPDGSIKWKYEIIDSNISSKKLYFQVTIDKYGNLYSGLDKLISLDHEGKIRWKVPLEKGWYVNSPISCDRSNNIYFIAYNFDVLDRKIYKVTSEGKLVWKIDYPISVDYYPSYAPCISNGRMFVTTRSSKKIFCIK